VVPGLAVHGYAELPVQHLRDNGYDARLLQPPAWRGVEDDLERYGRNLAADIDREGAPVDVLIGLSAGTQAAAVAASRTDLVKRLVLVSPTIDPAYRSMIKQSIVFVAKGDPHDKSAFFSQVPDWSRAGILRIFRGFASAIPLHLEDVLPRVAAAVTIIHAEHDQDLWSPTGREPATWKGCGERTRPQTGGRVLRFGKRAARGHSGRS
jgi:pimeloyl-ACP methyl ester carboxylesterase